jgi:hypothetical protein
LRREHLRRFSAGCTVNSQVANIIKGVWEVPNSAKNPQNLTENGVFET